MILTLNAVKNFINASHPLRIGDEIEKSLNINRVHVGSLYHGHDPEHYNKACDRRFIQPA